MTSGKLFCVCLQIFTFFYFAVLTKLRNLEENRSTQVKSQESISVINYLIDTSTYMRVT